MYEKGNFSIKAFALLKGLIRRFVLLFRLRSFDFVFIHREALPFGPPVIEWIIAKVLRKKIIYDFDDAIWRTDVTNESFLERMLRWRSKVGFICKWSYKVSCGNFYLAEYARQFNNNVVINPTTIDTVSVHNPVLHQRPSSDHITIGWTGSHSTLKYLVKFERVLKQIENKYPSTQFLVIADRPVDMNLRNLVFKKWSPETEIEDLLAADIGIMPLPDDEWTKGKCGFKALQYMALEIPAVVSPVGVNKDIVEDGVHGFLCASETDWFAALERLILNPEERIYMGRQGRQKVAELYSVTSNSANFLSLFQ